MNPLDLPVHPVVVHFPIALLTIAWAMLVLQRFRPARSWDGSITALERGGVLSLPVTIVLGFVDTRGVDLVLHPRWDQPLIWHTLTAIAASAVFTVHWRWRRGGAAPAESARAATVDLVVATAGIWLLTLAGMIAAEMVYGR